MGVGCASIRVLKINYLFVGRPDRIQKRVENGKQTLIMRKAASTQDASMSPIPSSRSSHRTGMQAKAENKEAVSNKKA